MYIYLTCDVCVPIDNISYTIKRPLNFFVDKKKIGVSEKNFMQIEEIKLSK